MPSFDFSVQWRCGGFIVIGLSGHPSLFFLACCPPGHLPAHQFGLNILGGGSGGQRHPVIPRVSDRRARTPLFALFGEREGGKVIHGRAHTGVLEIQGLQECI